MGSKICVFIRECRDHDWEYWTHDILQINQNEYGKAQILTKVGMGGPSCSPLLSTLYPLFFSPFAFSGSSYPFHIIAYCSYLFWCDHPSSEFGPLPVHKRWSKPLNVQIQQFNFFLVSFKQRLRLLKHRKILNHWIWASNDSNLSCRLIFLSSTPLN